MNILVIRFRQMGDAILATTLLNTLRRTFPDATIDFVLNERLEPLFRGHEAVSNIITFSDDERHSAFTYLRKVWSIVRGCHYDVIIDMRSTLNTSLFALFSPRTPFRIGLRKPYTWLMFNHRIAPCADNESMTDHDIRLAGPLNALRPVAVDNRFTLPVTEEEKSSFRRYMQQKGIDMRRPVVLVGVTTRVERKTWNVGRMEQVLRRMLAEWPQVQIVFNFSPGREQQDAQRVWENLGRDRRTFIDVEARSQRELCAMAANVTMYFGNEGGARHIVHAMGRPSFVVFAPSSDRAKWLPQNDVPADGVAPSDLLTAAQQESMTYEQRFDAITTDEVWQRLKAFATPIIGL